MLPTLNEGDIVIYKPIKSQAALSIRGCIVIAKDPLTKTDLLIKRVHRQNSFGIELRGDNEMHSIDSRNFGLIQYIDLLGIVVKVVSSNI